MTLDILARPETIPAEPAIKPPPGLVRGEQDGHCSESRKRFLECNKTRSLWRRNTLAWLRDHVWAGLPRAYYNLVLGHDLHISVFAELYARHFHYAQPDPFTGQMELHEVKGRGLIPGWWENIGLVSWGKVTDAFVEFEIDELQSDTTEYGDFKFHRVGTDATAENKNQTALIADSEITGEAGTQIEGATADIYKTVATVTADATETWQEHGIFSQAGTTTPAGTLMDRSLIIPTVSVVNLDTVEFTYELTKNAEA